MRMHRLTHSLTAVRGAEVSDPTGTALIAHNRVVEIVAIALYDDATNADVDPYVDRWDELRDKIKDTWRHQARVAIAAHMSAKAPE
jgi:hypothetical protein